MWHLFGITIVFLVSKSVDIEGSQDVLSDNDRQKIFSGVEEMEMGLLSPDDSIPKDDDESTRHLQKRSILKLDFHDGPTLRRLGTRSPAFVQWSSWPDIENDKIISSIEQHRNHALVLQERRTPSFSPWGGKRDLSGYKPDPKIRRPARVPFNSWGGKRSGRSNVIKKPFNSWGGKRSFIIEDILRVQPNDISSNLWRHSVINNPKLAALDPRDLLMSDFNQMYKKTEFVIPEGISFDKNLPRVPFDPWGGRKRDSEESNDNEITVSPSSYLDSE